MADAKKDLGMYLSKSVFFAGVLCAMISVFAFVGCGDSGPPTGDFSGTVTFEGEAVGDCRVMVYSPTTKLWLGGKVDDEGKFMITKVPTGSYQVAVGQRTTNAATEEPFDKRIPKKYRETKSSGFEITIEEGDNEISLEMTN